MTDVIVCAHHLRVRRGQPGYVVIETKDRTQRIAFLFDARQAEDVADELRLLSTATPEGA